MGAIRKVSFKQEDEINELYESGLTMWQISDKLNIPCTTVNRYVKNPRHTWERKDTK